MPYTSILFQKYLIQKTKEKISDFSIEEKIINSSDVRARAKLIKLLTVSDREILTLASLKETDSDNLIRLASNLNVQELKNVINRGFVKEIFRHGLDFLNDEESLEVLKYSYQKSKRVFKENIIVILKDTFNVRPEFDTKPESLNFIIQNISGDSLQKCVPHLKTLKQKETFNIRLKSLSLETKKAKDHLLSILEKVETTFKFQDYNYPKIKDIYLKLGTGGEKLYSAWENPPVTIYNSPILAAETLTEILERIKAPNYVLTRSDVKDLFDLTYKLETIPLKQVTCILDRLTTQPDSTLRLKRESQALLNVLYTKCVERKELLTRYGENLQFSIFVCESITEYEDLKKLNINCLNSVDYVKHSDKLLQELLEVTKNDLNLVDTISLSFEGTFESLLIVLKDIVSD